MLLTIINLFAKPLRGLADTQNSPKFAGVGEGVKRAISI
jgi:hypothetical protein